MQITLQGLQALQWKAGQWIAFHWQAQTRRSQPAVFHCPAKLSVTLTENESWEWT